jgi:hypothetical protein
MTVTTVGLYRTDNHRYHWNGGPALPGVTSIIGKVDKSGPLIGWAKGVTADAALNNLDRLQAMIAVDGRAVTRSWLTAHATAESDAAKDLGTRIHILAEQISRGASPDVTELEWPYIRAYQQYLSDFKPEFRKGRSSLERFVANLTHGYGGTFDFLCHLDLGDGPKLTLGDLKTGKGHYTETRLQLAALGAAEFIGMPNDPKQYPMPKVEQYAVLHVRPEAYARGYQVYRVNVTPADTAAFLGALAIYRWAEQQPSKGEPVQPALIEGAAA